MSLENMSGCSSSTEDVRCRNSSEDDGKGRRGFLYIHGILCIIPSGVATICEVWHARSWRSSDAAATWMSPLLPGRGRE